MRAVATAVVLIFIATSPVSAQVDAADAAWRAGDTDRAVTLYEARLTANPNDATALHRVGLARAWAERFDASLELFDRLLTLEPRNLEARIDRARVFAWRGEPARAVIIIDSLLATSPDHLPALQARAQFASWAGEYATALQTYDRILSISPDVAAARYDRARVLGWAQRYPEAERAYLQMLAADPRDLEALHGLATLRTWSGDVAGADSLFSVMLTIAPSDMNALRGRARMASWAGDLRDAERLWQTALAASPGDAAALTGLAQTLRWQGREAAAWTALQQATAESRLNPELRAEMSLLETGFAPRIMPGYTYEADSDGNRIHGTSGSFVLFPRRAVEARVTGYYRSLQGPGPGTDEAIDAYGISGGGTWQLEPGWRASLALGGSFASGGGAVSGADGDGVADDAKPILTARASLATPRWFPVTASLALARSAFDYTAALAARRIRTNQVALDAATRLSQRLNLSAALATTVYRGTESNRQVSGLLSTSYRLSRFFSIGSTARAFTFEKDRTELTEGYFNPDFYATIELSGSAQVDRGRMSFGLDAAPGFEQIGSDAEGGTSFRASGRFAYTVRPGRQVGVSASYANSGLQQLSPVGDAGYNYRALSLFGSWTLR